MGPTATESNQVDIRLSERPIDLTAAANRLEGKSQRRKTCNDAGDKMARRTKFDTFLNPEDKVMMVEVSEGTSTSHSSFAEIDSNSNGKTMASGPMENVNDNRQYMMPDGPVLKKVKQISMEEIPLHLTGLGLSGSGMQLFVKMDKTMEQTLQQVHNASCIPATPRPKTKKRRGRSSSAGPKKSRNALIETHDVKDIEMTDRPNNLLNAGQQNETNEGMKEQIQLTAEPNDQPAKNVEMEKMANLKQRKRNSARANHDDSATPRASRIYGCNQNFQPTSSMGQTQNVISGPTWNVDNGQIDIIKSQDRLRATPDLQAASSGYGVAMDYGVANFPCGFESRDLPLKRRYNSPIRERSRSTSPFLPKHCTKWSGRGRAGPCYYNASSDIDDDDEEEDGNNGNFCRDNDGTRKVRRIKNVEKGKNDMIQTKPNTSRDLKSSANEEGTMADFLHKPQRNVSALSQGEQSSIGPQFETSHLHPGKMDTDTIIKFTQYTQELRKDLKQKYKDLSKLLKGFEETVQQRHNEQTDETEEVTKDGKCTLM